MEEIWKDINGYEGLYQVSNMGRVKSLKYNKSNNEKILKAGSSKRGYQLVILCKNAKKQTKTIHRLVACEFIPNPSNYTDVNHKDEDKRNNEISNLEWMSHKDNQNYGNRNKKCSERQGKLVEIFKDGISLGIFKSTRELEKQSEELFGMKLFHNVISLVCNGVKLQYKGYIFKYTT